MEEKWGGDRGAGFVRFLPSCCLFLRGLDLDRRVDINKNTSTCCFAFFRAFLLMAAGWRFLFVEGWLFFLLFRRES